MACQLRDAGREVAYLALIDAGLPENGRLPGGTSMMVPLWWAISYPFVEHVPLNYQTLRMLARWVGISLPESLGDVWRRGAGAGSRFAAGLLASGWRSLRVFLASMGGFRRHEPRFFDGKVTLFRTIQGSKLDRGQDVLLKNLRQWCRQVEVHEAPGSHMTLMLDPKLSSAFAFSFEATLNVELAHNELQSS
jgi:thioesterase domain-containing protein